MSSTWIHVFFPVPLLSSLSLSAAEFHVNHWGISLQAPRSHQLPSATFCHSLSEGKYIFSIQRRRTATTHRVAGLPAWPNLESISLAQTQMCIPLFMLFFHRSLSLSHSLSLCIPNALPHPLLFCILFLSIYVYPSTSIWLNGTIMLMLAHFIFPL